MNRPIKFRAWDGERMQEDFCLSSTGEVFQFMATIPAKLAEREDWKLMQFTGLTDKNGHDIYEGDIIRGVPIEDFMPDGGKNRFVVYHEESASFVFTESDEVDAPTSRLTGRRDARKSVLSKLEVIGNIYENPDLLGV